MMGVRESKKIVVLNRKREWLGKRYYKSSRYVSVI